MRRKKDKSNGITALYERLSRDDDNAGESNSIVHQKQMLEDYAMKHGFTNLVHFTDDGWSGATFDRPSWNRLVEGVKNGEITACICKDMSRIGRDHLQVGFFTDILFREKEVRFIAINNGIDSDRQETSEFAPFLNIMNEWFVRDTSKKIKAVLKSRGSSGNAHTSNIPPYGYLKDPENPDHWIIDEEAAEVLLLLKYLVNLQQKRAKEREEEQKKGIIRTHYIIKTEKVLTMFFVLAVFLFGGATVASAIQQDDLLPPIGFSIFFIVSLIGSLNMIMWKLEVNGDEITWRSTFGRKRTFRFEDITYCERKKGSMRVYVNGEKLFTIDSNIDKEEFMEDIKRRRIPVKSYWANQHKKNRK